MPVLRPDIGVRLVHTGIHEDSDDNEDDDSDDLQQGQPVFCTQDEHGVAR